MTSTEPGGAASASKNNNSARHTTFHFSSGYYLKTTVIFCPDAAVSVYYASNAVAFGLAHTRFWGPVAKGI